MGMMEAGLRKLLEVLCATAEAPKPAGRKPKARRRLALVLEPRFLFDAAGVATAAAVVHDQMPHPDQPAAPAPDPVAKALADHVLPADPTASVSAPIQVRAADPAQTGGKKEVAFIDTSVADYQTLVAGVRAGVEVELIDSRQSGLAQIAKWAETHSGYDTVHVLSHGADATGVAAYGGDWVLEASTGTISVQTLSVVDYDATLPTTNFNSGTLTTGFKAHPVIRGDGSGRRGCGERTHGQVNLQPVQCVERLIRWRSRCRFLVQTHARPHQPVAFD